MKKNLFTLSATVFLIAFTLVSCSLQDYQDANLADITPTEEGGYAMGMGLAADSSFIHGSFTAEEITTSRAGTYTAGIDVSYYQGTINWTGVYNSGKRFAFIRAAYGTGKIDSQFTVNWCAARSAGLIRGAYQFFRPSQDAAAQANLLISTVGTLAANDLPVVIDVEVTEGIAYATITTKVKTWVSIVKKATGKTPIIYTSPGFWNALPDTSSLAECPLWIAHWGVTSPRIPAPWTTWKLWQYTDSGSVSGISGKVDLDYFNGDLAALKAFTSGTSPTVLFQKPFTGTLNLSSPYTTGSEVSLLQTLLNDWAKSQSIATIAVDGYFGTDTETLVKKFQTANGLVADGYAGPLTLNELVAVFTNLGTFYAPYTRLLKVTSPQMYGTDVITFQTAYNVWAALNGYPAISVDGYYGNESKAAARKFQTEETDLVGTPDGIAGKLTQRLLFIRSWK